MKKKMNKEQKIWLTVSAVSGIIFASIMTMAIYDIRFKYGLYILVLAYGIMFIGFGMFAFTQYISTREIISISIKKVRETNKERKIWFLISTISSIILVSIMTMAIVHDMRFKYGLYVLVLAAVITMVGFIMFAVTNYISTKKTVLILAKKLREW